MFLLKKYGLTINGRHLGRHLEYTKMLNGASRASCSFWFYIYSSIKINHNLLGGYFCKVQWLAAGLKRHLHYTKICCNIIFIWLNHFC